jgi:hypothetical protein
MRPMACAERLFHGCFPENQGQKTRAEEWTCFDSVDTQPSLAGLASQCLAGYGAISAPNTH